MFYHRLHWSTLNWVFCIQGGQALPHEHIIPESEKKTRGRRAAGALAGA